MSSKSGRVDADHEALLQVASRLVCTPLDRESPLWAARWVTGLSEDRAALILVMHHALTDGVGGIALLAALADGSATTPFPNRRRPGGPWPALPGGAGWHA